MKYVTDPWTVGMADGKNSGLEVCHYPLSACSVSAVTYAGQIFLLQEIDATARVNIIKTSTIFAFFMNIEINFTLVNG